MLRPSPRSSLAAAALLGALACGGPHERTDGGGLDGGGLMDTPATDPRDAPRDAVDCESAPRTPGCPCPRVGDIDCRSTVNQVRCTASGWVRFSDGECWFGAPADAGLDGG